MSHQAAGYVFPPEWHSHRCTWLSWPHNPNTWPNGISKIFESYARFVKVISQGEQVCINVNDLDMQQEATARLQAHGVNLHKIHFYLHPTNDAWIRDHGPAFVIHPQTRKKQILNWEYNAWGEKYPPYDLDNTIPDKVAEALDLPQIYPKLVMEGGAVDFNGYGTVLTTTSCLLNRNRNPHRSPREIEEALCVNYGVRQVLWLDHGILGDDTDGHIDDVTRFVNEDTVITMVEENSNDANHYPLQENLRALKEMKLWDGRPINIIPIQMPAPLYWQDQRLPASYANFYICNAAVVVPLFSDPQDQMALRQLRRVFTNRSVIGIDSSHLIGGLGSFHCLSQQEPQA